MLTQRIAMRAAFFLALLVCVFAVCAPSPAQSQASGPIYTVEIDGTITSSTIRYLERALQTAQSADATALIITMGSGGGVLREVRPFAVQIANATIPVVVYVAPETASGPSGTMLLSAAQINALAPNTSFGSPYPLTEVDEALSEQTRDLVYDSVIDQLRDWNALHGRNTEWIDRAVRDGALIFNEQAISFNPPAVDLIATDISQLQVLLENRTVRLSTGQTTILNTLSRSLVAIEPTVWESISMALTQPTLAFALLVLGTLLVYLEFAAPGTALFAGTGAVLILAALFGLFALPIQGWAMFVLLFALVLLGAEFFVQVHGALATLGLVGMIVSGLNLIDPAQAPGSTVAVWVVLGIAVLLGVVIMLGVLLAVRVRARPVATGQEGLIGMIAEVRQPLAPEGMVYVDGALWRAISEDGDADVGDRVRIVAIHRLQLIVRRLSEA